MKHNLSYYIENYFNKYLLKEIEFLIIQLYLIVKRLFN